MTYYEQGFITKCGEYGVDGVALLKLAQATQGVSEIGAGAGQVARGAGRLAKGVGHVAQGAANAYGRSFMHDPSGTALGTSTVGGFMAGATPILYGATGAQGGMAAGLAALGPAAAAGAAGAAAGAAGWYAGKKLRGINVDDRHTVGDKLDNAGEWVGRNVYKLFHPQARRDLAGNDYTYN